CRKTKLMVDRDVSFLKIVKIEMHRQKQNLRRLRRLKSLQDAGTADQVVADNLGSFGVSLRNRIVYCTVQSN
ncbi:unnamed protein product, partial [Bubo scandiacus]